jgi:hypothetical protein
MGVHMGRLCLRQAPIASLRERWQTAGTCLFRLRASALHAPRTRASQIRVALAPGGLAYVQLEVRSGDPSVASRGCCCLSVPVCAGSSYLKCRCRWPLCTVEVATYGYVVRRSYGVCSAEPAPLPVAAGKSRSVPSGCPDAGSARTEIRGRRRGALCHPAGAIGPGPSGPGPGADSDGRAELPRY